MAPFHIKAQILRRSQLEPMAALGAFEPRAEGGNPALSDARNAGKASWRQADVKRLIAAAEQAELQAYRVEVAPDGTLSLIVGAPEDTAAGPAEHGNLPR